MFTQENNPPTEGGLSRPAGLETEPHLENKFYSLNRILFVGLAVAGFGAILMSLRTSWFAVPVAPAQGISSLVGVVDSVPRCTVWFQTIMACVAICIGASWVRQRRWTMVSTLLASVACLVPLSFPYFVMVRSPQVSADAVWLQMQHDNLTWLGGDIYANAEFGSMGWRSKTYLIDAPRQLAVIELPSWSPWEIGLHRCEDMMVWLGYSNSFCQFVGKGWVLSVLGAVFLLLASFQGRGVLVNKRVGAALAFFTLSATVTAIVGWSLPFQASREIQSAAGHCSEGNYEDSLKHLQRAVDLLPVLGQDTYYVAQRGVLDKRLMIESEYAELHTANSLESKACYDQAFVILRKLVDSDDSAIRREALRGVLRFAIQDYNCARFELSSERFSLVLRNQPCDVKLIYLMQLQGLRESRVEAVDKLTAWMEFSAGKYNFGTKKVLRAVAHQHSATAAGLAGEPQAIWSAQLKAKTP